MRNVSFAALALSSAMCAQSPAKQALLDVIPASVVSSSKQVVSLLREDERLAILQWGVGSPDLQLQVAVEELVEGESREAADALLRELRATDRLASVAARHAAKARIMAAPSAWHAKVRPLAREHAMDLFFALGVRTDGVVDSSLRTFLNPEDPWLVWYQRADKLMVDLRLEEAGEFLMKTPPAFETPFPALLKQL